MIFADLELRIRAADEGRGRELLKKKTQVKYVHVLTFSMDGVF